MRLAHWLAVCSILAAAPAAMAQKWEFGGGVGGGFYTPQNVERTDEGLADAKIKTGVFGSAWIGGNNTERWGGEFRYSYQRGDLHLAFNGEEASFSAESHSIHYDFLWHGADRDADVRPYVAFGGGIKVYRGTGEETEIQPLSRFALLTRTKDLQGMGSIGAGVKIRLAPRWQLRIDVHDYITPFPKEVIAPNTARGSSVGGWIHDIVPMVGFSYTSEN